MRLLALASVLLALHSTAQDILSDTFIDSPDDAQTPFHLPNATVAPHRIAIIGAGAGGSSAAFWLSKLRERFGADIEIDVYEREGYIGGRSTTVFPYDDSSLRAIELGASIFVAANKNLWRATETDGWNLTRDEFEYEAGYDTGIWDGSQFLLVIKGTSGIAGWLETAKVLWRYGWTAPTKTQQIVQDVVDQFVTIYKTGSRWKSIEHLAEKLGWTGLLTRTAAEYFEVSGVSKKFSHEMIEAATRVNYGQNMDEIHALEGTVSLAATGASAVVGGNWRIFERFLQASGANVHLNTTVTGISAASTGSGWNLSTSSSLSPSNRSTSDYASIIIAAPFHSTDIVLAAPPSLLNTSIPAQPYVHLHVTLLTTTAPHPNPGYFRLAPGARVPQVILTTGMAGEPEFNSLTYHGAISAPAGRVEHVVKMFSKAPVSDGLLARLFGDDTVGWVYRKEWDAYPRLPPTSTFPPVRLGRGVYYVNAFEPFISTMETETLAARGVVDMLAQEQLGLPGICPEPQESDNATSTADDFVYGWDC